MAGRDDVACMPDRAACCHSAARDGQRLPARSRKCEPRLTSAERQRLEHAMHEAVARRNQLMAEHRAMVDQMPAHAPASVRSFTQSSTSHFTGKNPGLLSATTWCVVRTWSSVRAAAERLCA